MKKSFVILPGHPFYGLEVDILQEGKTSTQTWCLIRHPTRPGFNYRLASRWLSDVAPVDIVLTGYQHKVLPLSFHHLQKLAQLIHGKLALYSSSPCCLDIVGFTDTSLHQRVTTIDEPRSPKGMEHHASGQEGSLGIKAVMGAANTKQEEGGTSQ